MANAIEVADSISNAEEQIERAAKVIGVSPARRAVFSAIYHHKQKKKTITEIFQRTGLARMRVLQEARHLYRNGLVRKADLDEVGYEKIDFFDVHKKRILRLAGDRKKLATLPTKRKVVIKLGRSITIPSAGARVNRITIDDVETFKSVRKVKFSGSLPKTISEDEFKRGVQAIIGEPGEFKDWGGETSDLYSTRLKIKKTKRMAAAFGFKGPGQPGALVPGRMGKNGDQMQRLFQEEADVFFVQHWREIKPSVIELMRNLAIAKSVTTGKQIWYGIIDGQDSERLRVAYLSKFKSRPRKSSRRK